MVGDNHGPVTAEAHGVQLTRGCPVGRNPQARDRLRRYRRWGGRLWRSRRLRALRRARAPDEQKKDYADEDARTPTTHHTPQSRSRPSPTRRNQPPAVRLCDPVVRSTQQHFGSLPNSRSDKFLSAYAHRERTTATCRRTLRRRQTVPRQSAEVQDLSMGLGATLGSHSVCAMRQRTAGKIARSRCSHLSVRNKRYPRTNERRKASHPKTNGPAAGRSSSPRMQNGQVGLRYVTCYRIHTNTLQTSALRKCAN